MAHSDVLSKLRDKDPHTRYQTLKALAVSAEEAQDAEIRKVAVRICRRDKLAYNRLEAMNVLRHSWPDPDVLEAFRERLEDEAYIAEACIRVLGEVGDATAYQMLAETFRAARQMHVKLQVIQAFQGADQAAIFAFLKVTGAHESEDDRIRATILSLLGDIQNPTLRSIFLQSLRDDNARVRANAVEALSRICQGKELFQILAVGAKDRNNRVRANALKGLIELGVQQAVDMVQEMVQHQNPRFRSSAAWILGEVGERVSQSRNWLQALADDGDHNVTYRAGLSLERISAPLAAAMGVA